MNTVATSFILGPDYTGKGSDGDSSLAYHVVSLNGTVRIAQTSAGLTESPAGSGAYDLTFDVDPGWGWLKVKFYLDGEETGEIKWTFNAADSRDGGSDITFDDQSVFVQ